MTAVVTFLRMKKEHKIRNEKDAGESAKME
jgi:hypothetical protein